MVTMVVFFKNQIFKKKSYKLEKDFEDTIYQNSKLFFGKDTILISDKRKISGMSLGKTIPDGFLFDFTDLDDIKFYIIEVELAKHSFYKHILPQITKFFSFLKSESQNQIKLVEKLYEIINKDSSLKERFESYIGKNELYKSLKDVIEDSQNILLLIDEYIDEFDNIKETYTDTWDKFVKIIKVREYFCKKNGSIFTLEPDFRDLALETDMIIKSNDNEEELKTKYSEEFHLEGKSPFVRDIYNYFKSSLSSFNFNPQKGYISIRVKRNFAFLKFRKNSLRVVVRVSENEAREIIKNHKLKEPAPSVKKFYNGECMIVTIKNSEHLNEIVDAIKAAQKYVEESLK